MAGRMTSSNSGGEIAIEWRAPRVALVLCASVWLFYAILAAWLTLTPTGKGLTNAAGGVLGNDFLFFYSASKMLLAGDPIAVFDQDRFFALQESIAGQRLQFPWAYPPHLLLLVAPLALVPYVGALYAWLVATTAPVVWLIRRLSGAPFLVALILPPLAQNASSGQNGALTASLAAGGLAAIAAGRPLLSGLLFGCLLYKPQVFVLAPICLLACREPRAFAGFAITGLGLPLLGLVVFGPEMWRMFFEHLPDQMSYVTSGRMPRDRFATVYVALQNIGAGETFAKAGQGVSTLAAWALVYWCWRRTRDVLARAFAFCVAMPLSSPYMFEYDLALWSLPAAMLATRVWNGESRLREWIPLLILAFLPPLIWMGSLAKTNFGVVAILALAPFVIARVRAARD